MTIHTEHPFWPADDERDPLRRFRGRMPAPVTVWTTGTGRRRAGLTVSSLVVADGDPAHVLGLVDEESPLWEAAPRTLVVNLLGPSHEFLADAFAGTAPAPGGPFRLAEWEDTAWGPVLVGAAGWLGVRLDEQEPRRPGWALLLEGEIEHAEVGDTDALTHVRGRYRA